MKQLKLLTTRDLFSEPKLRENVTEEDIKNLEEQLPTVAKNKKEKAETYVNDAWGAYDTQQTVQFFVTEMNYNNDTPYQVLEVEKINLEKLEEAHERVKQLPEGKERRRLSEYLEQIEQAR